MDKSILQKYTAREEGEPASGNVLDLEITDDVGSFGWIRGLTSRCVMLELRKKGGNCLAVGYGWIERIEFDPSQGIVLFMSGHKIRIKGRNLNAEVRPTVRLFEGLTRHRIPWICEASQTDIMEAKDGACLVEEIEW
jgi:hypothetical protein